MTAPRVPPIITVLAHLPGCLRQKSYNVTPTSHSLNFILQVPPNFHPFVLEGLVRTKTFFTLLLGVAYSVSKSESSSSSEVRNYDHHKREGNQ